MPSIKKSQRRATAKARVSATKHHTSRQSVKADDKRLPLHDLSDPETDKALDMHLLPLATKLRTIYEECMKKTDSPQSCHSRMMEEAASHFNELKEEAQLMVELQHKALRGEVLSDDENKMHRALQPKQNTIQSHTSGLQKGSTTGSMLSAAVMGVFVGVKALIILLYTQDVGTGRDLSLVVAPFYPDCYKITAKISLPSVSHIRPSKIGSL